MSELWKEVALMTMSAKVRKEYEGALAQAVLKHGLLVGKDASFYGWHDWTDDAKHVGRGYRVEDAECHLVLPQGAQAQEDEWGEFEGTFYEGDTTHHGAILRGLSCACGRLKDRSLRWEADMHSIAEAVFEVAFGDKG